MWIGKFRFARCYRISLLCCSGPVGQHIVRRKPRLSRSYSTGSIYLKPTSGPLRNFRSYFFCTGAGRSAIAWSWVKKNGLPKVIAQGKQFPFVMVAPQNPKNQLWDDGMLLTLLDEIIDTYRIDEDRIYLTGLSRGGFGTWRMAIQNPDKFAAVVPVCGGGVPDYAKRIKEVPVWAFHGAKDRVIPLSRSVAMVEALLAAGGKGETHRLPRSRARCLD